MTKMNMGKVLIGGLVAGVVMNIVDFITNTYWLSSGYTEMFKARNLDPSVMQGTTVMVQYIALDFLFGIIAVWTYAAMRPRFGAGPGTAVIVALQIWLATSLVVLFFQLTGMFTMSFYIQGSLAALCSLVPGTLIGAKLYSE